MRRIIKTAKPRWVLAENVAGHIRLGLDEVLADLEALDYACGAVVIPACAVGQWHRRNRVWIIAHADQQYGPKMGEEKNSSYLSKCYANEARLRVARWEANQPSMVGVAHGISNRMDRIRGLGNAIVPQIAAEIFQCIVFIDSFKPAISSLRSLNQ